LSPHRDLITIFGIAEPLSALTHLGTALGLAAFGLALLRRGLRPKVSLIIFTAAVLAMFLSSATYHALPTSHPARQVFWHLDHASIWIVLAATFSAVRILYLEGRVVPTVVALWTIALTGVTLEMVAMRDMPLWISPTLYILMGWCGLPTVLKVWRVHGADAARPMLLAGSIVTIGGVMDAVQWPHVLPGVVEAHELLHLTTVIAGSVYFHRLWCAAPIVVDVTPAAARVEAQAEGARAA
jgi:hemolysin III